MLNPKLKDYVEKVLNMGFSPKEIEDVLLKKGYQKDDVKILLNDVMAKRKKKRWFFQHRITDMAHDEFVRGFDKKTVGIVENQLDKGCFPDQIVDVLSEKSQDREKAEKLVYIMVKKGKRKELFHKLTDEIKHVKEIEHELILHPKWIKRTAIIIAILLFLVILFFRENETISLLFMKLLTFVGAVPAASWVYQRLSQGIESKEVPYIEALRIIGGISFMMFFVNIILPFYATLVALPLAFYILMHLTEKNYDMTRKDSFLLSIITLIVGVAVVYAILAVTGLVIGVYEVLIR